MEEKIRILNKLRERYDSSYSPSKTFEDEIIKFVIQNDHGNTLNDILTIDDFKRSLKQSDFDIACKSDAHQVFKKLLPHLRDTFSPKYFYALTFLNPIDCAVENKTRMETIKFIYENTDESLNEKYMKGRTALHTAVDHECNIKTIEYLVEKGFDPHKKDKDGKSPWTIAVKNAYDDVIKYFLSKFDNLECDYMVEILKEYYNDFDLNQEFQGEPLLHYAITQENAALCSFLIQKGASFYQNGSNEISLLALIKKLSTFFSDNDNKRVKKLMKKLTVNLKDENGNTKLHLAAQNGDSKEIISLLGAGAYYHIKNEKGETPKDIAKLENKSLFNEIDQIFIDARNNNFDFITEYEKGSFVYSMNDQTGKTLMHYAVIKNNEEAVNTLISISDDNSVEKDSEEKTPVYYAVGNNNKEILEILLNQAPLDLSTLINNQAFKEIEENDCKTLILHIKKCTDYAFNEDLGELNNELGLIKNNKDFNFIVKVKPRSKISIVDYAQKYPDIALHLLQKGIVVHQFDISEDSFIKFKIEKILLILIQIAEYVMSKKIEPESIIKYFNNKFMEALSYCTSDKSVADRIISNVRFDFENIDGATLLHIAGIADEAEIAQWLINEKHADPFAKDHNDNDVYTLAVKNNSQKVLSVLPPKTFVL